MAYERKPGELTLFKNEYKDNDRKPDYKGRGLDLNGNEVSIAAWVRQDRNGKNYMSLKLELPRDSQGAQSYANAPEPLKQAAQQLAQDLGEDGPDLPF